MAAPKRPRRQKKGDLLRHQEANRAEVATDFATGGFDRQARIMDAKWGVDRLPELVQPDTARKYGEALAYLNDCIRKADPEATAQAAANCIRGMAVMDAEAEAAGQPQATGEVIFAKADGETFGILIDDAQWPAAQSKFPNTRFVSLREVALAIECYDKVALQVDEIQKSFPKAHQVKRGSIPDDEIPF
jgi:hypothetical protein